MSQLYHKSLTVQQIKIPVFIKSHALVANIMLIGKTTDNLVFTPKYFYCFKGNVGNMAVIDIRLTCVILFLIKCSFRKL